MNGFMVLNPYLKSNGGEFIHIYPITNLTLSDLQRGHYKNISNSNLAYSSVYMPSTLENYTRFSLTIYFSTFLAMIFIQSLTIFIFDKIWVKNIPQSVSIWDQILHSIHKSNFPFPFNYWHDGNGGCNEHAKRKKAGQHEVLVTIVINLIFHLIMLVPLLILCKNFIV